MICPKCKTDFNGDPFYDQALASHGIEKMAVEYWRLLRLLESEGCTFCITKSQGVCGYDIDGVLAAGFEPEGEYVVVSGRTYAEYDDTVKNLAQHAPVYIRGSGAYGDREHAGQFKALMVEVLGLVKFYEDDPLQAEAIMMRNPLCDVILVRNEHV